MTTELFQHWAASFNDRMRTENQHVLFLSITCRLIALTLQFPTLHFTCFRQTRRHLTTTGRWQHPSVQVENQQASESLRCRSLTP